MGLFELIYKHEAREPITHTEVIEALGAFARDNSFKRFPGINERFASVVMSLDASHEELLEIRHAALSGITEAFKLSANDSYHIYGGEVQRAQVAYANILGCVGVMLEGEEK